MRSAVGTTVALSLVLALVTPASAQEHPAKAKPIPAPPVHWADPPALLVTPTLMASACSAPRDPRGALLPRLQQFCRFATHLESGWGGFPEAVPTLAEVLAADSARAISEALTASELQAFSELAMAMGFSALDLPPSTSLPWGQLLADSSTAGQQLSEMPAGRWREFAEYVGNPEAREHFATSEAMAEQASLARLPSSWASGLVGAASAGAVTPSHLLLGIADYSLQVGSENIQDWVVSGLAERECPARRDPTREYHVMELLPRTCAEVSNFKVAKAVASASALRSALEADARGLAPRAVAYQIRRLAVDPSFVASSEGGGKFDPLLSLLILSKYVEQAAAGSDPLGVIARRAWMVPTLATRAATDEDAIRQLSIECADHPIAAAIAFASGLYATAAADTAPAGRRLSADRGRYALLALAVNARSVRGWPSCVRAGDTSFPFGATLGRAVQAMASAQDAFTRADSIRTLLEGIGTAGGFEHRAVLLRDAAMAAVEIARVGVVLTPPSMKWRAQADSALSALAATVNESVVRDYAAATRHGFDVLRLAGPAALSGPPGHTVRIAAFASEVATAGSADDVKSALATLVAGGRGYARKRADAVPGHWGYWSVNTYPGGKVGGEWVDGRGAMAGGLTLPLGLELGLRPQGRLGIPIALFIQIADLGALTSWRFGPGAGATESEEGGETRVDPEPRIGFPQVVSPGVFLVAHPFGRAPFSLGIGYDLAPRLRNIVAAEEGGEPTAVERSASARRISVFLAADVPLVP